MSGGSGRQDAFRTRRFFLESDEPKNRLPYTLAFRLPEDNRRLIASFRRKLAGLCLRFDPLEISHVTVKYLGYSSPGMTEENVVGLIPRIREIAGRFIPLRVFVRGIDMFDKEPIVNPVVFLKILPCSELQAFHESVRSGLGKEIEDFPHADGENYLPHITVSKMVDRRKIEAIRRVIYRSRKCGKNSFKLTDLVVFTPLATYPVFI